MNQPINTQRQSDASAGQLPGSQAATTGQDGSTSSPNAIDGRVVSCDAHYVEIQALAEQEASQQSVWGVGRLIAISVGRARIISEICKVENDSKQLDGKSTVKIKAELIGEISPLPAGDRFSTGISSFPYIGCPVNRIQSRDLLTIYDHDATNIIEIGHLTQDPEIPVKIDHEKLLNRHFAVVGSTGVGKSTAVSLLLSKIVNARQDIRVVLIDPHNEFSSSFPENGYRLDANKLVLPFWLFNLEELSEVVFRGEKGLTVEKELLRDLLTQVRQRAFDQSRESTRRLARNGESELRVTADTPVPYRMVDLLSQIELRYGKLDNKIEKPHLRSLSDRINSVSNDPRFQFMFDPNRCGGDRLEQVVSQIFRIPNDTMPVCVLEMSGIPAEVVNSAVSVLCRLAFDLALNSHGTIKTLVVCEEAHRYVPSDPDTGFWPARMAIGRIAKEGRKYGAYLGVISQRPSELDPTILSQCNTIFAMRLSNQLDQNIISGAFTGGAQSTVTHLSSISDRECIAFGEAIYSPMRMTFETVEPDLLPGAHINPNLQIDERRPLNLTRVLSRMRGFGQASSATSFSPFSPDPYCDAPLVPAGASLPQRAGVNGGRQEAMPPVRGQKSDNLARSAKSIVAGMKKREEALRRSGPIMTHINGKLRPENEALLEEFANRGPQARENANGGPLMKNINETSNPPAPPTAPKSN